MDGYEHGVPSITWMSPATKKSVCTQGACQHHILGAVYGGKLSQDP